MPKPIKTEGKRVRRTKLTYDLDLKDIQVLLRIDLILEPEPATPVTPKLEARLDNESNSPTIPRKQLTPRSFLTVFSGNIERTVVCPYRANNSELIEHLKELNNLSEIKCLEYNGEYVNSNLGDYLS